MGVRDWLSQALEEFGLHFARARSGARGGITDPRVEVYLGGGDGPLLVGVLREEDELYVFEYSPRFRTQDAVPPISSFPDKDQPYRSKTLFPFFNVRIPPRDREDVQTALAERGIQAHEVFRIVGELASKSPTSPYVLVFREDDDRSSVPPKLVQQLVG
jgi:HipA-like protein